MKKTSASVWDYILEKHGWIEAVNNFQARNADDDYVEEEAEFHGDAKFNNRPKRASLKNKPLVRKEFPYCLKLEDTLIKMGQYMNDFGNHEAEDEDASLPGQREIEEPKDKNPTVNIFMSKPADAQQKVLKQDGGIQIYV